jgi:PAS domain S-box-containing protein
MGAAKQARSDSTTELVDQLLANVADAMVVLDTDGRILRVNTQAEKLFGYCQEELLGQKPDLLMPKPQGERIVKGRPGQVARPKIRAFGPSFETVVRHKDGHPIAVSVTVSPVKTKDGIVVAASVVGRDITEHKEAQDILLSHRALIEACDDAIIGKTIDGTIISWNEGAEKIYGYKAKEILGKPISVLMPPGHPNEFPEIMRRLRRGEHIEKFETKRIHKDGHLIDISVTISPVRRKDGTIVGASVVARDITLQKQAEEALRLSEERFRVAVNNAPVVVFSHDLQLRYTWINSPALSLSQEDYLGRTDAEIFGGDDGARLTGINEKVLRTGMESHAEVTVTLKGVRRYFNLVVEPLRDPRGKLVGLLCSAIDITSMKETILKLQQSLDEVQVLKGLLPMCASCKRIKDEHETWQILEIYIQAHSGAKFTHGICPDCMRKFYPEYSPP